MTKEARAPVLLSPSARAAILAQTRCPKTLSRAVDEAWPAPPEEDQAIAMAALEVRGLRPWIPPGRQSGALLLVKGALPTEGAVAVVGARASDPYGLACSERAAEACVQLGQAVISGGADGCDAAAHRATLALGGQTFAVFGSGHDRIYPQHHKALFDDILASGGGTLSPFWPETPPARYRFIMRNRVIAGLSEVVIVARATERSGALNTGRVALKMGRHVLAVPGSVRSALSRGVHQLLAEGARPMLGLHSLRACFGMKGGTLWPAKHVRDGSPWGRKEEAGDELSQLSERCKGLIVTLKARGLVSFDELLTCQGGDVSDLLADLLELRIGGFIEDTDEGLVRLA